eukprot:maker-scaffold851_size88925-snap-gene-0.22 protein:Tk09223 transcript:maker-scaffold851_size88925-snap-gene-0.22-mRNA-1 annotation:"rab11 family-interacting protein 4"
MELGQDDRDLKAVFEICQPRSSDRKISLKRLQKLFEEHAQMPCGEFMNLNGSNPWISYDEFCHGITSFVDRITNENQHQRTHTGQHLWHSSNAKDHISGEEENHSSFGGKPSQNDNTTTSSRRHPDSLLIPELGVNEGHLTTDSSSHVQLERVGPPLSPAILCPTGEDTLSQDEASPESQLRDFFGSPLQSHSPLTNYLNDMSTDALEHSSSSHSTVMNSPDRMSTLSPGDRGSQSPVVSLTDSALGGSASPDAPHKSNCSSLSDRDEVNFESYGENDDVELEDSELADFDEIDSSRVEKSSPVFKRNIGRRHSWMRTSLRRVPSSTTTEQLVPPKRWGSFRHPKRAGSNALASALYHNGSTSFNSSGRSSNCDEGDAQSDISLEEDVNDLNQKEDLLITCRRSLCSSHSGTKRLGRMSRNYHPMFLNNDFTNRAFEKITMSSVTSEFGDLAGNNQELEEGEDERLEYDLWDGQFRLTSEANPSELTPSSSAKAIKNARNQKKLLDRWTSQDIDNLITEFDTLKGFDYDSNERKFSGLERQMSCLDSSGTSTPKNRGKNGDSYTTLCWTPTQGLPGIHDELSEDVQMLQEQVGHLTENQASTDDKYSKVKQDNTSLISRIHMLEENIRELELRSDERLEEEQKRNRELLARLEREKHLEIENHTLRFVLHMPTNVLGEHAIIAYLPPTRLQSLEKENTTLHLEATNLRSQLDRLKLEKRTTEDYLLDAQNQLAHLQDEHHHILEARKRETEVSEQDRANKEHLIVELTKEVEHLSTRSSHVGVPLASGGEVVLANDPLDALPSRLGELESEIRTLREERRHMEEKNEELMGQILNKGLEEGKSILISTDVSKPSIDHEIQEMSENQIRTALKEQKEVNYQLRNYIDGILMNIIEKYPELLEVRK